MCHRRCEHDFWVCRDLMRSLLRFCISIIANNKGRGRNSRSNTIPQEAVYCRDGEIKFYTYDMSVQFGSITSSGTLVNVPDQIVISGDVNGRQGRVTKLLDFDVDGILAGGQSNLVTDDKENTLRVIIFDGVPGLTTGGLPAINTTADPRYVNGLKHVYLDEYLMLVSPAPDSTGYMPAQTHYKRHFTLNRIQRYIGSGIGTTDVDTLYIYIISDSNLASHPGFIKGRMTLRWTDL